MTDAATPGGAPEPGAGGSRRATGLRAFLVVWAGQLVSLVGSALTRFALGLWVLDQTGSVTRFAMVILAATLPGLLVAPLAGALVDRWDRRRTMLGAVVATGLATAVLAYLLQRDLLEVWQVYVFASAGSVLAAFHWPAYVASSTLLVPKRHLGRSAGMIQLGQAAATTLAPVLTALLIVTVGMAGVVLANLATLLFAAVTLLPVRIPNPAARSSAGGSLWREAGDGWSFIRERAGLLGLLVYFALVNLFLGLGGVLVTPLVLSFATTEVWGVVMTVVNAGLLAGAVVMIVHGGPRPRIHGVLGMGAPLGIALGLAGLRPDPYLVAAALCAAMFAVQVINGSSQVIWQTKVPAEMQGRVFALRRLVAQFTAPVAYLAAGPLADRVFEPLMASGGALAGSAGRVLGVGEGRGIGLLFVVMAAVIVALSAWGYLQPRVRRVEEELPDALPDEP